MSFSKWQNTKGKLSFSRIKTHYLLLIVIVPFLVSCASADTPCDYCKTFINNNNIFPIPLRNAKLLNSSLGSVESVFKYEKRYFLTESEVENLEENLFCFLGYTEKKLLENIEGVNVSSAIHSRSDTASIVPLETKTINLYFSVCQSKEMSKNDTSVKEFYPCFGSSHGPYIKEFFLDFKLHNGRFIFCGNKQDSIKLKQCNEN